MTDRYEDRCGICGGPIVPYGQFGHRFIVDVVGPICTECARKTIPSEIALADEMDRRLGGEPEKEKPK